MDRAGCRRSDTGCRRWRGFVLDQAIVTRSCGFCQPDGRGRHPSKHSRDGSGHRRRIQSRERDAREKHRRSSGKTESPSQFEAAGDQIKPTHGCWRCNSEQHPASGRRGTLSQRRARTYSQHRGAWHAIHDVRVGTCEAGHEEQARRASMRHLCPRTRVKGEMARMFTMRQS